MIKYCDYIHTSTNFPRWNENDKIETGIYPTIDCEIRVAYKGTGVNVNRIAGFTPEDGVLDNEDFRLLFYNSGSLDVWNSRQSYLMSGGIVQNGKDYDFTFGNFFVKDNIANTTIFSGTSTSMNTSCSIKVDVGGQRLSRLVIKNGGVVVFDGHAAVDDSNNTVGLYDTVSNQMFTNSNLNMTYDNILPFSVTPTSITSTMSGGTFDVSIINPSATWSAITTTNWITLSKITGSTSDEITVTIPQNRIWEKYGAIIIMDGLNLISIDVTQLKNTILPYNNLYRNGQNLN